MTQNVISETIPPGKQKLFFEKPYILRRIFFGITALLNDNLWYQSRISFDGPKFYTFYVIDGPAKHFEIRGDGLPQGDIWVRNASDIDIYYTAAETLI